MTEREITLYVVGESRNDAAENGGVFNHDDLEGATEYARNNGDLNVYRASVWIRSAAMVEIDEEEYSL